MEIIRMCNPGIAVEEGVRAKQDGRVGLIDEFRHDPVMQRRGIEVDRNAAGQRHDKARRQPERVEHRQHVEHLVVAVCGNPRQRLDRVGEHVAMREHHSFRRALAARGEQDRRRIVRPAVRRVQPYGASNPRSLSKVVIWRERLRDRSGVLFR